MKKQYVFIVLILIVLLLLYVIVIFKNKEYKVNSYIESIKNLNIEIKQNIKKAEGIIEYKSSKAYRNKIIKQDQGYKNKEEKVIYLTPEKKYNKFTKEIVEAEIIKPKSENENIINSMSNYEKWIYFLFEEDIR